MHRHLLFFAVLVGSSGCATASTVQGARIIVREAPDDTRVKMDDAGYLLLPSGFRSYVSARLDHGSNGCIQTPDPTWTIHWFTIPTLVERPVLGEFMGVDLSRQSVRLYAHRIVTDGVVRVDSMDVVIVDLFSQLLVARVRTKADIDRTLEIAGSWTPRPIECRDCREPAPDTLLKSGSMEQGCPEPPIRPR